ncbi:MAG: ABC transporter substrate-binding protein [Anaerolineales bacterium]
MKKIFGVLPLVVLFMLFATGCTTQPKILIGFSGELTGTQSELGVSARNAAVLAVEEINNNGGINGKQIQLLIEDDLGTPEGARAADLRLVERDALVIIGHMTSSQTLAAWEAVRDSGVILFSPTTSTPELSSQDDNFLRFIAVNTRESALLAQHIAAQPNLQEIAILYDADNPGYADTFQENLAQHFIEANGKPPRAIAFHGRAALDFSELIQPLLTEPPDAVVIIASAYNTALIVQQMRLNQINCPIFIALWARTEDLIRIGGASVDGIQFISQYDTPAPSDAAQQFSQKFQQRYGSAPTFSALVTYDIVYFLASGLQITNGSRKNLKQTLLSLSPYEGLLGTVQMDAYGDVERVQYLGTIQNGVFIGLYSVYRPAAP